MSKSPFKTLTSDQKPRFFTPQSSVGLRPGVADISEGPADALESAVLSTIQALGIEVGGSMTVSIFDVGADSVAALRLMMKVQISDLRLPCVTRLFG